MNNHSLRVYDSILDLLSSVENPTPLVRLNRVLPFKYTQVYGKLEWYNPFGAIKDRVAANLIVDGEARQTVHGHQKLVEPTSGNTGMALAMIANVRGYSLTTPLSSEIPLEKRTMLRFFGAEVMELQDTLCPAPGAPEGAIAKAAEIGERPNFHMLNQYAKKSAVSITHPLLPHQQLEPKLIGLLYESILQRHWRSVVGAQPPWLGKPSQVHQCVVESYSQLPSPLIAQPVDEAER